MEKKVEQFWRTFCKKHNLGEDTKVDAWAFGASKEEANELADLVKRGIKTATTAALFPENEMPSVGDWNIILD